MKLNRLTTFKSIFSSLVRNCILICLFQRTDARPVIGILSQPHQNDSDHHYIAASYVKWLESAGAASIPIPYDSDEDLINEIFSQINGILFPGGGAPLPKSAQWLWNLALQSNERGDFFPVWGTCLGFEFLVQLVGGKECLQSGFNAENVTLPLLFPSEEEEQTSGGIYSRKSHLYPTDSIRDILSSQNITMNNHHRGITPTQFLNNSKLTQAFKITSTNFDLNGRQFVSTIESRQYPIYGIQWHPEKNNFEYGLQPGSIDPFEAINHSEAAVDISIQLSKFFVSKARNSTIGQYTMFSKHPLIYTYPVISGYSFEQEYKIPPNSTARFKKKEDEEEFTSRTQRLRGNKIISTIR